MLFRWVNFIFPRILLGAILAFFLNYCIFSLITNVFYLAAGTLTTILQLGFILVSIVSGWSLWTIMGQWHFQFNLNRIKKSAQKQDLDSTRKYLQTGQQLLFKSSHFSPHAVNKRKSALIKLFTDYCVKSGLNDTQALIIYQEYLELNPQDTAFARKLIPLLITSTHPSSYHLSFCQRLLEIIPHHNELILYLSEYYLKNHIFTFESQTLLLQAIKNNSILKHQSLEFLLRNFISQEKTDGIALEVYLQACKEGLLTPELKDIMGQIAEKARFEEVPAPLILEIRSAFDSLPTSEKEQIKSKIQGQRLTQLITGKLKTEAVSPPSLKEIAPLPHPEIAPQPQETPLRVGGNQRKMLIIGGLMAILIIITMGTLLMIKPPTTPSTIQPESTQVLSLKPFTIQIAAFRERERAEKLIHNLKLPQKPYISVTEGEKTWYQVRMGHYDTMSEALQAAEELLKNHLIANYFIANFTSGNYIE